MSDETGMGAKHHTDPRIGIFYGSSTCYTEMAAEKTRDCLTEKLPGSSIGLHNIADGEDEMEQYPYLILGIPTWDYGELQEDWDEIWDDLENITFNSKRVAIFGLGDQVGYPQWFQDALGYLYHRVHSLGATMVGHWPVEGYQYEQSQALTENEEAFLGLPLDEENEADKSQERIEAWCTQILKEFGLSE